MTSSQPEDIRWQRPQPLSAEEDQTARPTPRTAVLIFHGMGKQLRFQSLNDVAAMLAKECESRWETSPLIQTGQVKAGDDWLSRAELTLKDDTGKNREIHLYEAYWAPLTEGKVTARDVTRFLYTAAWQGMRNSLSEGFDRWMFGGRQRFRYPISTLVGIIAAFLLISGMWGAYAVVVVSAVGFFTRLFQSPAFSAGQPALESVSRAWAMIDATAVLWLALLMIAWSMRRLYVQYVGDVAAYVSSHDVSKFNEIRNAIQNAACKATSAVYQAQQSGQQTYDKVIVVAHSLGSLIAYDALNRLINEELAETGSTTIPGRTKLFLTFGSPLDKIAFIFRNQKKNSMVREALAAAKQPMIVKYDYRPAKWINLHSWMDPVSGPLTFYDEPAKPRMSVNTKRIDNRLDPRAWIPGWAHVQYWSNPQLRQILMDELKP